MRLPAHLRESLREAYRNEYGVDLAPDDADALGAALVDLYLPLVRKRARQLSTDRAARALDAPAEQTRP